MKNLLLLFISMCCISSLFSQDGRDGYRISPIEIRDPLQAVKYQVQSTIDQHTLIDKISEEGVMNQTQWIDLYNMSVDINPERDLNPGRTIWQEIKAKHTYEPVLVSINKKIRIPQKRALNILIRNINAGKISADEAIRELENIKTVTRTITGVGIHLPVRRYDEKIRIRVLPQYQLGEANVRVHADEMDGGDIIFDNTTGINTIDVHVIDGKNKKTIRTTVMEKGDSDKYKTTFRRGGGGGETLPCGEIINDTNSTILTTGLPCTGGCPPNQPTVMAGETLTIPGNDGIIDRVVIITDGIDFTGARTVQVMLNSFGGASTFQSWLNQGIDIIFVDWPSPMGYVENNSQYLRSIIEDLNASDDFVAIEALIGLSMGGVISRHTLLEMEEDGVEHNVKTWVSGDAPQEGANVSVGTQAFARETSIIQNDPALDFMNSILDSPATRQLLLFQVGLDDYNSLNIHTFCWSFLFWGNCSSWIGDASITAAPDPLHTSLWNWFNSRYPTTTEANTVIIDGGTTTLGTVGQTIMNFENDQALIRSRAANGLGTAGIIVDKDYNSIFVSDRNTVLLNNISNIDVAPGSTFNVSAFNQPPELIFDNSWSFVTSTSAAGIPGNPQNTNLSSTPFDATYMTPTNDAHTVFTPAKIGWLQSQMDPSLFDPCATQFCEELFEVHECRFGRSVNRFVTTKDGQIHNNTTFGNHSPNSDNFTASVGLPISNINLTVGPLSDFVSSVNYTVSNGNINFSINLDEDYIENYFNQLPLPQEPIWQYCDERDFVLNMSGTVEYEGCDGEILSEELSVNIIYTYDFCIEVWDLDNPLFTTNLDNSIRTLDIDQANISMSDQSNNEILKDISSFIAPNPAQDFFTINGSLIGDDSSVTLFNIDGKKVLHQNITRDQNTVNSIGIAPGIYVATIVNNKTQKQVSTKLIIN